MALLLAAVAIAIVLTDREPTFELPGSRREAAGIALDAALGATVEPLDQATAESLGVPPRDRGLVVTSLGQNGPAAQAGIRPGDVIERIGGAPVSSVGDAAAALKGAPAPEINLTLNRRGLYAIVQLPIREALPGRDAAEQGDER